MKFVIQLIQDHKILFCVLVRAGFTLETKEQNILPVLPGG